MIEHLLSISIGVLACGYAYLAWRGRSGFLLVHSAVRPHISTQLPRVTIIVAAHNEEHSIANCLDSLLAIDYPTELTTVIVVDDQSTDGTRSIVASHPIGVHNLRILTTDPGVTGKINAVRAALNGADTEIILITDADCSVPSTWVRRMIEYLEDDVAFVAGPVLYNFDGTVGQRIQALEFLGLVAVGAGSIGSNIPTICNSANLCYRRSVYVESAERRPALADLPGFDEVLIQTIPMDTNWRVAFSPGNECAVRCNPASSLAAFIRQRARWASMGGRMPDARVRVTSVAIFVFFGLLVAALLGSVTGRVPVLVVAVPWAIKIAADLAILLPATRAYQRKKLLSVIIPAEIVHIPYILVAALLGLIPGRSW